MSAPVPYSRLAEARGETTRAARARSNERALKVPQPALSPLLSAEALSVPAGLRRRQAAARRLPPVPGSGKRDPIAPARPQTLLHVSVGRRTAWYEGLTRRQFVVLMRRAGVQRWMHDGRAFCTSITDADDVLAVADHGLRWRTVVTAVDR